MPKHSPYFTGRARPCHPFTNKDAGIAVYGCLRSWAQQLGKQEAANLIEQMLHEEKEAARKLTRLAESRINPAAHQQTMSV